MKAIILAAGSGSRMGSITNEIPKCMVVYNGKPLIDYTLEALTSCGIRDVVVVVGYRGDVLAKYLTGKNVKLITNEKYAETNMVYTLFSAESEMNDDLVVSYADIIYGPEVLEQLIKNENRFVVTVDKNWRELWNIRMEDPLKDAETMKFGNNYNIVELGKKPKSYKDIQGQYIGLFKISNSFLKQVCNFHHELDKAQSYDGKDFNNM